MTLKTAVSALVALAAAAGALAQSATTPLDGRWRASYEMSTGSVRQADVVIRDDKGSWTAFSKGSQREASNPCLGREMPATVTRPNDDEVTIAVQGSQEVKGCPDFTVRLHRVDDKTLEGQMGKRPIKLVLE